MSLIGKIYTEYRIPGSYHHDHAELPNGDIIALTQDLGKRQCGRTWWFCSTAGPGMSKRHGT